MVSTSAVSWTFPKDGRGQEEEGKRNVDVDGLDVTKSGAAVDVLHFSPPPPTSHPSSWNLVPTSCANPPQMCAQCYRNTDDSAAISRNDAEGNDGLPDWENLPLPPSHVLSHRTFPRPP
jgi:hypothetical protein